MFQYLSLVEYIFKHEPIRREKQPVGVVKGDHPRGLAWRSNTGFILITITIGITADIFLHSVIVPILPFVLRDRVAVPPDEIQSTVDRLLSAYALASTVLSPLAGAVADHASSRRVPYLLGLLALIIATMTWFLGKSVLVLTIARVAQGASCAIVYSVGLAMVIDTVGEDKLGRTFGTIFSVVSFGGVCAPVIGGLLYELAGYNAVSAACFAMLGLDLVMRLFMIEKRTAISLNAAYTTLSTDHTDALELADAGQDDVNQEEVDELSSPLKRSKGGEANAYLIPKDYPSIYRHIPLLYCLCHSRSLALAELIAFSQGILLSAFNATIPLYAAEMFGFGSLKASLLFLPLGIMNLCFGPIGGWVIDHYGTKFVAVTGFGSLAPALASLRLPELAAPDNRLLFYVLNLAMCGLGLPLLGSASVVEAGIVVKKYHRQNPSFFPAHGPYAQLYAINHTVFSLGLTVGPLISGVLKDSMGYGNMNAVLAGIAALTALVCFLWLGERRPRGEREHSCVAQIEQ